MDIIRKAPIKPGEPGWNCVIWVKEALTALQADGKALGTSNVNWNAVRDAAMWYVEKKKAEHRFDGKGNYDSSKAPTWQRDGGQNTGNILVHGMSIRTMSFGERRLISFWSQR